ncbi:hypothetical protein [Microbacterium sp.]|uniref:oxidoreductase n=1 Tax=Microbacterium sp. TaxID=51671 RepID=UPI003A89D64A
MNRCDCGRGYRVHGPVCAAEIRRVRKMALDDRYSVLFEPVRIGPKTAKNRFWCTPHAIGFGSDNPGSAAAYRGMRAEGGWGVVFTEATTIAPETDKTPHRMSRLWDAGDVRNQRHRRHWRRCFPRSRSSPSIPTTGTVTSSPMGHR